MEVSSTDFFQAVRKVSQGDETLAKTITDYVEQTGKSNHAQLKEVFLTKDDKIDIIDRLNRHFLILLSTALTIGGVIIALAVTIISKLH